MNKKFKVKKRKEISTIQMYLKKKILRSLIYCVSLLIIVYVITAYSKVFKINVLPKRAVTSWQVLSTSYTKENTKTTLKQKSSANFFHTKNSRPTQQVVESKPLTECDPVDLTPKHTLVDENVSCQPHKISKEACEFVKTEYKRDDSLKKCESDVKKVNICKYVENVNGFKYFCKLTDCQKYKKKSVSVKLYDSNEKSVVEKGFYSDDKGLTSAVIRLANETINNGFEFMFLECLNKGDTVKPYQIIGQYFILPPEDVFFKTTPRDEYKKKEKSNKINVNIILLDSAARSHFYRSLPSTIATMNNINKNSTAEILDFQLFQSIEGHTAENLRSLFTGEPFPKHYTSSDRESHPVGIGSMFKRFTDKGYYTIYHDDLCYDEYWGVRLDMGSPRSWDDFLNRKKEENIKSTGLTFSNCYVLNHNNVTNPFNGPDLPLCFNGKFQDGYFLDYSYQRHQLANKKNVNLISFTSLNVAHDDRGMRIQSVDYILGEFLKKISTVENTLTFLLADHGNTYTRYTHAIMEGRFEQFHPSFFMIIPDGVKRKLGDSIIRNLRENQKKLVTMMDISYALKYLPVRPVEAGLFSKILINRTCDDLNLRLPNLCVCEGWDAETLNDTRQIALLDFAVGQLNNMIAKAQQDLPKKNSTPKCHRLIPTLFTNVRERNKNKYFITSFDFNVPSGKGSTNSHDVFHVEIQSIIDPDEPSRRMELLSFDRMSKYGPYRACADRNINMRLCVCDSTSSTIPIKTNTEIVNKNLKQYHQLYSTNVQLIQEPSQCVVLRIISYPEKDKNIYSSSFEVANNCNRQMKIKITVDDMNNLKSIIKQPITWTVLPYTIMYVGGSIRDVPYWDSQLGKVILTLVA